MERRGRPAKWENDARRALTALGGQASETDVLRWVQEGRVNLPTGWQAQVLAALRENSDGRGQGIFEIVSDDPRKWRLIESSAETQRSRWTRTSGIGGSLGQMIRRASREQESTDLSALDRYLLALMAYELDWHAEAITLIDLALANGLHQKYLPKAEQVRSICSMKLER